MLNVIIFDVLITKSLSLPVTIFYALFNQHYVDYCELAVIHGSDYLQCRDGLN